MYMRNISGPNIVPCGTPDVTGDKVDFVPDTTTLRVR